MLQRITILLWMVMLAACSPGALPPPEQSGELVVVTRNSPTTYYLNGKAEEVGFERDLAVRFAESRGWRVRFVLVDTLADLFTTLNRGKAHLAAAGLTITPQRRVSLRFGPEYGQVEELVVCKKGERFPELLKDLKDLRLEVVADSSHLERLRSLRPRSPGLVWAEMPVANSEELLERVDIGLSDCAVTDSDSFAIARHFHPTLDKAFALGNAQSQAWVIGQRMSLGFSRQVIKFFQEMQRDGELEHLRDRYFGHVQRLADADVLGVLEKRGTLLRELTPHFHQAELETELDWRLLAAVAYQESQWDAQAVSFTGVRGIMMLTEDTADEMGVQNRLDPRESILGGARYIVNLMVGLPDSVPQPDRTWMALAAYNLGMGHLQDARTLATRLGRNPDSWNEMKEILPLLSRGKYASTLKYGFARGGEALAFAENVRIYYDILLRYEKTGPQ